MSELTPDQFREELAAKVKGGRVTAEKTLKALRKRPGLLAEVVRMALDEGDIRIAKPWSPEDVRRDLLTDRIVAIVREAEEGDAAGVVWEAYDPSNSRPVADGRTRSAEQSRMAADEALTRLGWVLP